MVDGISASVKTDTVNMPKLAVPLTDIQPRTAKSKDKPYKLSDGGGLYLLVNKDGAKYWRMDYRFCEVCRTLAFGKYPEVTLAEARTKRLAARKLLDQGVDPSQDKKERQREQNDANAHTFEKLAREWHTTKLADWSLATARDTIRRLEIDIFPEIGNMPIGTIKHQHVIAALRKIEKRGAHEIAHRIKATCARVFSYANQNGITNINPAADIKDVLKPVKAGHFAAISTDELPAFLAAMDKNDARLFKPTRIALRLMMLIFLRTSELIETPWSEINLVKIPLKVLFGQRLRELRRERGMSQEAFADHCGYARSYMSRLERGAGNPSLDAIEVLASALDVEVVDLFTSGLPTGT